jgi:predicted O-linked N-acetylglucosamine transferase (SPINDLY family)
MAGNIETLKEANYHYQKGNTARAAKLYRRVVKSNPDNFLAHYVLGAIEAQAGNLSRAKSLIDQALAINPSSPEALLARGNILAESGRLDEALVAFEKTLAIKPGLPGAWVGLGNIATSMKQFDKAFADYDRALALNSELVHAWFGRGNLCLLLDRVEEASAAFDRALALRPDVPFGWCGRGNAMHRLARYGEALGAHQQALALAPNLAEAWVGCGNALGELKRYEEALAAFDEALKRKPHLGEAWHGRANTYYALKRYEDAAAAFEKARALNPKLPYVDGALLRARTHLCDWREFDAECEVQLASIREAVPATIPFYLLAIPSSAEDQLRCAMHWFDTSFAAYARPKSLSVAMKGEKIRVGYLSADFRQHPVATLTAGLFEQHNRKRFHVSGFSVGANDGSDLRRRIERSFDHFFDLHVQNDLEIVERVRRSQIDILVDLNGYTQDARTGVFARGAAPIQVNYLGYAGTTGSRCMDYIIADTTVIPEEQRKFYTEKIVYLPGSFLVNDARRTVSDRVFTRTELGLAEADFVFCCFNDAYKITPAVFDSWMRILGAVANGVLWLSGDHPTLVDNLRREAATRHVDPRRLVFAPRLTRIDDHLARFRSADLFLDTLFYNAHATGSDALWAGLPVLTCVGSTFAGRVGASLLNALGLQELVVATMSEYEATAIEIATDPSKLIELRRRLDCRRPTAPLFDTALFAGRIEAAFEQMVERHRTGLPPEHIFMAS